MITMNRVALWVVRQFTALKLGYFNLLNIMMERNSIRNGRTYFHRPIERWPSSSQRRNKVMEAITPAAAVMGKPVKFLSGAELPLAAAATQLNRASRRVPHARYTNAIIQPRFWNSPSTIW